LLPLSNTFIKHMGRVHRECMLAESACEALVQIIGDDLATMSSAQLLQTEEASEGEAYAENLREELSKLASQNQELQVKLRATEIKLEKESPDSQLSTLKRKKLDESDDERVSNDTLINEKADDSDLDTPIDTIELARTVTRILNDLQISKQLLAREVLDYEYSRVCRLISTPKPWAKCRVTTKRLYQKMLAWSKSETEIKALQDLEYAKSFRNRNAKLLGLPDLPETPLDTVQVSQTLRSILKSRNISLYQFEKHVLEGSGSCDEPDINWQKSTLRMPRPWDKLIAYKKKLFAKVHDWCSSNESIRSLEALVQSEKRKKKQCNNSKNLLPNVSAHPDLDTGRIVCTIQVILKAKDIPVSVFAKQVFGLDPRKILRMIRAPKPWAKCNEYQKKLYLKMHQWSQSSDAIRSLAALKESQAKMSHLSYIKSLPKVHPSVKLDTAKISSTLDHILQSESIMRHYFADKVLKLNQSYLSTLLNRPVPWAECTKYKKKLFHRIHEWCQSSDEIKALKASLA
jgi:hypothetical protein